MEKHKTQLSNEIGALKYLWQCSGSCINGSHMLSTAFNSRQQSRIFLLSKSCFGSENITDGLLINFFRNMINDHLEIKVTKMPLQIH